jgi:hypothetical protein
VVDAGQRESVVVGHITLQRTERDDAHPFRGVVERDERIDEHEQALLLAGTTTEEEEDEEEERRQGTIREQQGSNMGGRGDWGGGRRTGS